MSWILEPFAAHVTHWLFRGHEPSHINQQGGKMTPKSTSLGWGMGFWMFLVNIRFNRYICSIVFLLVKDG
jgi:hypothetical protein